MPHTRTHMQTHANTVAACLRFVNQACAGLWVACTWFLKIGYVWIISMCVCVNVCVYMCVCVTWFESKLLLLKYILTGNKKLCKIIHCPHVCT